MKIIRAILLYLLVLFYLFMGSMHLLKPDQYIAMIPSWLPAHSILILLSGIVEIVLGILLVPVKTRATSARLIIGMLAVFFFVIHIPQSIDYYKTGDKNFVYSIIRLPIQFLFVAWASIFVKKEV